MAQWSKRSAAFLAIAVLLNLLVAVQMAQAQETQNSKSRLAPSERSELGALSDHSLEDLSAGGPASAGRFSETEAMLLMEMNNENMEALMAKEWTTEMTIGLVLLIALLVAVGLATA